MNNPAQDPFFSIPYDTTWNACIGPQGNEENYVDGYVDAALLLASLVIEKEMMVARDTLVLPILYNARHGVELSLKFAVTSLRKAGFALAPHPTNHDIGSYWRHLRDAKIGDEELRQCLDDLESSVKSLSSIDDDGQQLRYATDRDGGTSLLDKPLANIRVIRDSLKRLQALLRKVKYRVHELCDEHPVGTHTVKCSRKDLMTIAALLPPRSEWGTDAFAASKEAIRGRYSLGSRNFSDALKAIEANREMRVLIGLETPLAHLTDAHARLVAERWSACNPPREPRLEVVFTGLRGTNRTNSMAERHAACTLLLKELSVDEVADLEVIFYLGRDGGFPETYEQDLERKRREHAAAGDLMAELRHIFTKMNLLSCLVKAFRRLGRSKLADELKALRPEAV